ncbi:MAG: LysR family transcriptional regulator [Myxococcaceae bacterium]
MQINPSDMVLFVTVVRAGSFTAAASQLGVTKQSISERIANLEERLSVRLLERTTRQLRVTGAGATYYDRCAAIVTQIDQANNEVQQGETDPVGLIRVASPTLYGRRYLAPVVSKFLIRHPKARVELILASRRINVVEDGLDVAIQIGLLKDSSLVAKKLGEAVMHYVASPRLLKTHGTPKAAELSDARCIGLSPFETWDVGGVRARIDPVLIVSDHEVACDAAVAGVGIARVPAIVCKDAVREGRLKILFPKTPPPTRPIHVVYPSKAYLPSRVRHFVDALTTLVEPLRSGKARA